MLDIHDFSAAAKEEVFRLIDEVAEQDEAFGGFIVDAINDAYLYGYILEPTLFQSDQDLEFYRKFMIDKLNIGKEGIEKIWSEVYDCETNHLTKIQDIRAQIGALTLDYARLMEMIDINREGGFLLTKPPLELSSWVAANFCDTEERASEQEY